MQAYVINLNVRTDRWDSVLSQWRFQTIPLNRIEAIDSNSISRAEASFLPPPVVANWRSQCLAYREFLSTNDSHALILEDDFMLGKIKLSLAIMEFQSQNFDFLQLGYLYNSYSDYFNIWISNFRDLNLKILNRTSAGNPFLRESSKKMLVSEQAQVPFSVVLNDARAGSHAYLISRKFAEFMLTINEPTFLATDGLFIAIANLRFLKMGRLRSNSVKQSNSPSSITSRFIGD